MKIHIVQQGDTIWGIAKKYGVEFEQIKELNPQISSPDMIMPGMKLKIPSSSKQVKKDTVKETTLKKEIKKEVPKKVSPKPIEEITEDDKEKPKEVKMQVPVLPKEKKIEVNKEKKPMQMPVMPKVPMQPIMHMPIMETEMQVKFTEPPIKQPIEKKKKKVEHNNEMVNQQQMGHNQSMTPMYCYMVHPCCMGMHHQHPDMNQGCMPMQQHPHMNQPCMAMQQPPSMNYMPPPKIPMNPFNDCGNSLPYNSVNDYASHPFNEMSMQSQQMGQIPQMPMQQQQMEQMPQMPMQHQQMAQMPQMSMQPQQMAQMPQFSRGSHAEDLSRYPSPPSFPSFSNYADNKEGKKSE